MNGDLSNSAKVGWGVSFDSAAAQLAGALVDHDASITQNYLRFSEIPAAALVPRVGERTRVDLAYPPHPRGTGRSWPPEAAVDREGCGRFPLLLAWGMIDNGRDWEWPFEAEIHRITPVAALAAGVREMLPVAAASRRERSTTLVIPNHWQELAQQNLLDALHAEGISARLLWRPVAAALAWCERMTSSGNGHGRTLLHSNDRRLLVVYAGLDAFELTLLDLVAQKHEGTTYLLPGRRRPVKQGRLVAGCGFNGVLRQLSQAQRDAVVVTGMGQYWETMWASPWLSNLLLDDSVKLVGLEARNAAAIEGMQDTIVRGRHTDCWNDLIHWCRQWAQELRTQPIVGAVIIGPLANTRLESGAGLAETLLEELSCRSVPPLVEGRDDSQGLLARGAALYSARLLANLPTYLDTLPRLQTVIVRSGEPCWIDLLQEDQQFVDGGKAWRRPENLSGLALAKGSRDLKLALSHEDFRHVREVVAPLPCAVVEREAVSISVAIEPAQGNARLEVLPENPEVFSKRRVVFNWKGMTELELPREAYINSLPRIYPTILPRLTSPSRWQSTKAVMAQCTRRLAAGASMDELSWGLHDVKQLLQQKDASYYPQDATAIGSDGEVPNDQEVLAAFIDCCVKYLRNDSGQLQEYLIRAVAYTSTGHSSFLSCLHSELLRIGQVSGQHVVTACGWCFRDPSHIASFASIFEKRLQASPVNSQVWWKAFSEILRYRTDAARDISSEQAMWFTSMALQTFESQRQARRGDLLFRYVSLVIVYLLRRRAYEDAYLDPESPLAQAIKQAFARAQNDVKSRRLKLIGGAVNLGEQLQLMIDYVDRRGRGQLLMGV